MSRSVIIWEKVEKVVWDLGRAKRVRRRVRAVVRAAVGGRERAARYVLPLLVAYCWRALSLVVRLYVCVGCSREPGLEAEKRTHS